MIIEEEIPAKQLQTEEIPTVPRPETDQGTSSVRPKCLFSAENDQVDRSKRPGTRDFLRKRKYVRDSRTRVLTEKGKPVLSSDIHLHLQKLQQWKAEREAVLEDPKCSDEELNLLEQETKRLDEKLAKHEEIRRLQLELQQTSLTTFDDEDLQYNDDDYLGYEEST